MLSKASHVKTSVGMEARVDGVNILIQSERVFEAIGEPMVNEILQWLAIGAVLLCVGLHTHPFYWWRK